MAQVDAPGKILRGRFGVSRTGSSLHARFQFEITPTGHLFNASLARNVDLLIRDSTTEKVQQNLPDWFKKHWGCSSFLFFPIRTNTRALGAVFARWEHTQLSLSESAVQHLQELRNLLAIAINERR